MFTLSYCSDGAFSYGDVMEMDVDERRWYRDRLAKQLDKEHKAAKKAASSARRPRVRKR